MSPGCAPNACAVPLIGMKLPKCVLLWISHGLNTATATAPASVASISRARSAGAPRAKPVARWARQTAASRKTPSMRTQSIAPSSTPSPSAPPAATVVVAARRSAKRCHTSSARRISRW